MPTPRSSASCFISSIVDRDAGVEEVHRDAAAHRAGADHARPSRSSRTGVSVGHVGDLARPRARRRTHGAARCFRASASARAKTSRSNFRPSSNFGFVDRAATASTHLQRRREVLATSRRRCCARTGRRRRRSGASILRSRTRGSGRASATSAANASAPSSRSPSIDAVEQLLARHLREQLALHRLAADDHVQRGLDADHARQALRAAGARQEAELHLGQRDLRARRGDAVVAAERELEAAAHADAVDRGDDRLGARLERARSRVSRFGSASAFGVPNSLDVGAARERLAGAGDDDRLDRRVGLAPLDAVGDADPRVS